MSPGKIHLFYRRASFEAFKVFGINKAELNTLLCLEAYLKARNKTIISWREFVDIMTGNNRESAKIKGHYWGLNNKGFIGSYEYIRVPGSLCVGITPKGFAALKAYQLGNEMM